MRPLPLKEIVGRSLLIWPVAHQGRCGVTVIHLWSPSDRARHGHGRPSMRTLAALVDASRCRRSEVGSRRVWPVTGALAVVRVAARLVAVRARGGVIMRNARRMTMWQSLLYCAAADVTLDRIKNLVAVTGTEPLTVDFKEGGKTGTIAECAAAMANAQGGLIFVGITDRDRDIVGVPREAMAYVADVLAMTVDEGLHERAVGQDRQALRPCGVQCGLDEKRSKALALARRVDLGVDEGYDAGSAPVLRETHDVPVDGDLEAPAV